MNHVFQLQVGVERDKVGERAGERKREREEVSEEQTGKRKEVKGLRGW